MPQLCVIPGDGIGREVIPAAVEVLQAVVPNLETIPLKAGWDCFQECGASVPSETLEALRSTGAGLFGAVSSPSHRVEGYRSAILTMRQTLDLYGNIRPVHPLPGRSPNPNVNMIVVRENTEGLYVGQERRDGDTAIANRVITRKASYRIGAMAARLMEQLQRQRLTIVHKANVLPVTDGLFRDSVREAVQNHKSYSVAVDELLVDVAALKILESPEQFDCVVTTNLFGDILSDAAAYWGGGLGLAPSLNLGDDIALAEPVHGSAPDIAGTGQANPTAAILSAALLARHAWNLPEAADQIESAVGKITSESGTDDILQGVLKHL